FRYDLHTPRTIERPDLTARGTPHQAEAMVGETTYDTPPAAVAAPAPPPPPPKSPRVEVSDKPYEKQKNKKTADSRAGAGRAVSENAPTIDPSSTTQGIDIDTLRQSTIVQTRPMTA